MDGFVDLLDPDGGPGYRFVVPEDLTGDPDVSNFCAACHDSDGALRLASPFDPFGDGTTPPDVATRFSGSLQWNEWYGDFCLGEEGTLRAVNSHHDISDQDQAFSGAKLECLNCHGSHLSGSSQVLADPWNAHEAWTLNVDAFCLACHRGGASPDQPGFPSTVDGPLVPLRGLQSCDYGSQPWYVDHAWLHTAHGSDSKRGWEGYSGAPSAVVGCMVCHDPHGSYTVTNPAGNPYAIRDVVDGTAFVDDGVRPGAQWTGPPWNTSGTLRTDVTIRINGLTVGWGDSDGLCSTCHENWITANEFHSTCGGCQSCHGHGQSWGENDWGPTPNDATACNPSATEAPLPGVALNAWLSPNHPNPFNPSTTISYSIPRAEFIELDIYDLAGRHVRTLESRSLAAGPHQVQWNGKDDLGNHVASGVYTYQLRAGDFVETKRMVLLK